jgi:hypothetical protein
MGRLSYLVKLKSFLCLRVLQCSPKYTQIWDPFTWGSPVLGLPAHTTKPNKTDNLEYLSHSHYFDIVCVLLPCGPSEDLDFHSRGFFPYGVLLYLWIQLRWLQAFLDAFYCQHKSYECQVRMNPSHTQYLGFLPRVDPSMCVKGSGMIEDDPKLHP